MEQTAMYTVCMIRTGRPSKTKRSEFGKRLYQAREQAGLTQVELADKLGVIQQVVAAWERRDSALKPEQIKTLSEVLGTSSDYLLGVTNNKKPLRGPSGRVRNVFEEVSHLPRRQQQQIVEVVEALIEKKAAAR